MTENVYEGLFILDSNRYNRDPAGVSGVVGKLIEKHGGSILVSRLWDERRLAYSIKGHRKGTYWLTYFRLNGEGVQPLNQETQRTDNILRHLILKVDPRIVDTLVSHAQQQAAGKPRDSAEAKPAPDKAASDKATSGDEDASGKDEPKTDEPKKDEQAEAKPEQEDAPQPAPAE